MKRLVTIRRLPSAYQTVSIFGLQNGLKKTEAEIQRLEERSGELTEQMALPEIASDIGRLMELHREKEAAEERLSELYEDWERFSEELERLG